jgi:hypothetical protein
MKRGMNIRIGDGRGLGESSESETLGDGGSQKTVVLLRLISESEETEKDECAKDGSPSSGLKRNCDDRSLVHQDPGVLEDTGVSPVGISPGDPWANITPHAVRDDTPSGQRYGETKVDGSQNNETPVTAVSHVASGGDEIPELLPPLHEGVDGEDWK